MVDLVVIVKPMESQSARDSLKNTSRYVRILQSFPCQLLNHRIQIFLRLQIFYFASVIAIKTSLILLYYRLFGVTRWFRWELAFAWVVVILCFIVDVLVAIFECKPVSYFWDKSIPGGTCINQDQFFRWNGAANLLIDFMILTLTVPVVWHLKLKTRQKLSLAVIFLLGLLYVLHSSLIPVWITKASLIETVPA